jgi:hypothetical protein
MPGVKNFDAVSHFLKRENPDWPRGKMAKLAVTTDGTHLRIYNNCVASFAFTKRDTFHWTMCGYDTQATRSTLRVAGVRIVSEVEGMQTAAFTINRGLHFLGICMDRVYRSKVGRGAFLRGHVVRVDHRGLLGVHDDYKKLKHTAYTGEVKFRSTCPYDIKHDMTALGMPRPAVLGNGVLRIRVSNVFGRKFGTVSTLMFPGNAITKTWRPTDHSNCPEFREKSLQQMAKYLAEEAA